MCLTIHWRTEQQLCKLKKILFSFFFQLWLAFYFFDEFCVSVTAIHKIFICGFSDYILVFFPPSFEIQSQKNIFVVCDTKRSFIFTEGLKLIFTDRNNKIFLQNLLSNFKFWIRSHILSTVSCVKCMYNKNANEPKASYCKYFSTKIFSSQSSIYIL